MKDLVHHWWQENRPEIVAKSRLNCHAKGLHSIMLCDKPEQRLRLFITEPDHDMGGNTPTAFHDGMSVGFHSHHCNLTMLHVLGYVQNWTVRVVKPWECGFPIRAYRWSSGLTGGTGRFSFLGADRLETVDCRCLSFGRPLYMPASVVHTVAVPRSEVSAWFILEGRDDPAYQPITYSTADLTKFTGEGLYRPMPEETAERLLSQLGMI